MGTTSVGKSPSSAGLILLLLGIVLYLARQARTRPNLLPGIVQ
jgi:hypothetical protein